MHRTQHNTVEQPANGAPLLVLDDVVFERRSGFVLGPLTVTFHLGVSVVLGPNGAGKTTLFDVISGIEKPSSGRIVKADDQLLTVGYLPQLPRFPERATPRQFLEYVCWLHGVSKGDRKAAVNRALDRVGLSDRAADGIKTLSGGMQRRLGIAQAIVHSPDVVLLDEPAVGLDPQHRIELRRVLRELGREAILILSTHLVDEAALVGDRLIVLSGGQLAFSGTGAELASRASDDALGDTPLEKAFSTVLSMPQGRQS